MLPCTVMVFGVRETILPKTTMLPGFARPFLALLLASISAPAFAGDVPLYQSAPAWIAPAPPLDSAVVAKGATVVLLDQQVRIEKGTVTTYADTALRADTPEALTQLGTLSSVWSPDKGDLIIHRAIIVRDGKEIDLLAGRTFTVLQRERGLERRMLDGLFTATLPVSGLQVGDLLRFVYSVTRKDAALRGHAQELRPLIAAPTAVGFGRLRVTWPATERVRWQAGPKVVLPAPVRGSGGDMVLTVPLPLPKRDPMPDDAPSRFRRAPLFQVGDFADWPEVSRTFAPLFATDGLIAPDSPVAREVAAIMAASPDPRTRTARALELVQSRISYLLLGMNGGNYQPPTPAETWEKRYGDCKAKSLLLLSMLRAMGITSEAVLALLKGGDALAGALPMPADFDHVLVRAIIDGQDLWLDGTGASSRLADIADVPPLFHVLPLRPAGADLMALAWRKPERPNLQVTLTMDESAGIDLPVLVDGTMAFKGSSAAMLALAKAQSAPEKQAVLASAAMSAYFEDFNLTDSSISVDSATGISTIHVQGLLPAPWRFVRGGARLAMDMAQRMVKYTPDRARPMWRAVPVAVTGPDTTEMRLAFKLPDGGKGYRIEGNPEFSGVLAGQILDRTMRLEGDGIVLHLRRDAPAGAEVAPADVATEKARLAQFRTRAPIVRAPVDAARYWEDGTPGRARFAALDAAYALVIARKPDEADGYADRARFRRATFDRKGAFADFAKALSIEPTVALYRERAAMREEDGKYDAAMIDVLAALDIDPANTQLAAARAHLLVKLGRKAEALAVRQEALDNAGTDRALVVARFAEMQAEAGETPAALAALDEAALEKPGNPEILNLRCWLRGTRQADPTAGLKDCTRAIELADLPGEPLDSRAMIYYRLGRMDEALADLDAALEGAPGQSGSLFMRGVIRAGLEQPEKARKDLAAARRLAPAVDRQYREFGIVAPF